MSSRLLSANDALYAPSRVREKVCSRVYWVGVREYWDRVLFVFNTC